MTDPMERLAYRTPAAEHLGREVLEVYPDTLEVLCGTLGERSIPAGHEYLEAG